MPVNKMAPCSPCVKAMKTTALLLVASVTMLTPGLSGAMGDATSGSLGKTERAELVRLVRQDCGSCHGMKLTGGLGTPLTREALAGKPVESMAATIIHGRPGTAMPPWKTLLTEAQAQWIAEQLIAGFPEETP